ncbi:MAG: chemotaxis protein CheA [Bacteroidales bacterium]
MDPILQKFRTKFIEEAFLLLDQLEQTLLELEQNFQNTELIHAAFRAMHTLKGTSSMYGFESMSEFTHQLESIYQKIRDNKLELTKNIIDISLKSVDHLRQLLQDEHLIKQENKSTHSVLLKEVLQLQNALNADIPSPTIEENQTFESNQSSIHTYQILLKTDEQLYFRGINLLNIFKDLAEKGDFFIEHLKNMSTSDVDWWNVIYTASIEEEELREMLMFIEDNCFISHLSEQNLIELVEQHAHDNEEKSILEYIENSYPNEKTPASDNNKENGQLTLRTQAHRISVDSAKLDQLMYLVSELITINSQLAISVNERNTVRLEQQLEKLGTLSKQFRNNALELRLVPLAEIILRFQRLIRDLSRQLQKKIKLVTHGIETELDKSTIDHLYEPLMHIVRNCIDHGIETPEVRRQKGKPEEGIITISAFHSGNHIVIKVEDDGCGIDHEKVRRKAVEKGIWPDTYKPNEKEIYDLIFMPGFSTAQSLTAVSGRGVGMDVVLKKIQDLRGNIEVSSQREKGTCFTISLQQTLSILDTLLFNVENQYFMVPITEIEVCEQLPYTDIVAREWTGTLPFRNQLIPFFNLRKTMQLKGQYPSKVKVIVVNHSQGLLALLADRIIGEHQAVLKPLGTMLRNQRCISAASEMGNGHIAFLIDVNELFHNHTQVSQSLII